MSEDKLQSGGSTPALDMLARIAELDATPDSGVGAEGSRLPRELVIAAFEKLWADASDEAASIALDGMLKALQRASRDRSTERSMELADLPELMTVKQAAEYLRTNRHSVYVAVRDGSIPSTRFGKGNIRIPRSFFEDAAGQSGMREQGSEHVR